MAPDSFKNLITYCRHKLYECMKSNKSRIINLSLFHGEINLYFYFTFIMGLTRFNEKLGNKVRINKINISTHLISLIFDIT